jgi:cell fate regulator YaaT (PSP1 superfamily)
MKKARYQGMDLKESRLIGVCGRLKCCLMFETMDAGAASPALVQPIRTP